VTATIKNCLPQWHKGHKEDDNQNRKGPDLLTKTL
jgi:hypothetical protein